MTNTNIKKSLLIIQKLKQLLQEQRAKIHDPIAIIGMSCRLPQAKNHHEFWSLLCQGKNVIRPIPDERWALLKNTREVMQREDHLAYWGGYLDNIDAFDAYFFGISPREAIRIDPQQRQLLEVSYESLEDAGLTVDALTGSNTGVFSSLYANQFSQLQMLDSDMDALFIPTGSAVSMAANRLSYLFDLRGPSMTLDTACSSSLIAIQIACLNLQAQLCEQAIVSAAHINLFPSVHSVLSKASMLSKSGQCKTFDANADGYVQGEGVGAIVLKPLANALKDKDRIYAVIMGSAVNQDGKTNGLTAPNGRQQEQLLRAAYRAAKIDPKCVSYVECHGTGTFLGDPIEIQALGEVIGKERDADKPCWISSVKTNIGHLEPAAGVISMIKVALSLQKGVIPSHLNFKVPNPHIAFDKYCLRIPTSLENYPQYADVRIAGVSSFGFGGANAHIVLREASSEELQLVSAQPGKQITEVFTLAAKDATALRHLIGLWCDYLQDNKDAELAQLCYNVHLRRSHYSHRLAIVTHSVEDLWQKLNDLYINKKSTNNEIFLTQEIKKSIHAVSITDFDTIDVFGLAKHYVNNAVIDWKKYEENRFYTHLSIPLYPWQHKQYWPSLGETGFAKLTEGINTTTYPLRGKKLASPLSVCQFEFTFDTQVMPEIEDTFHVLHAGYYIEMLAYANNQLHQKTYFSTQNIVFISPLLVPHGKTVQVQLIIENGTSFHFYSNDGTDRWIEHAKGFFSQDITQPPQLATEQEIVNRSLRTGTSESFYNRIRGMGMPAGESIKWVENYWVGDNEFFCSLRMPQESERSKGFVMGMHLGIIDACIQTLFLLLPTQITKPYIASHIGSLEFYGIPDTEMYVYAQLKEQQGTTITGNWYLLDKNHRIIIKCDELCLAQLGKAMPIDKVIAIQSAINLDLSLPYKQCKNTLIDYLVKQCSLIFSMPQNDINIHQSLQSFGMDSLIALAVMRIIKTNLDVDYSLPNLMQGISIDEIAEHVLAEKGVILTEEISSESSVEGLRDLVIPTYEQAKERSVLENNPWILNRKIQDDACVRLFCFPYGGGGATIYREWQEQFPSVIEICPVQLPGRENRLNERPIDDIKTLVSLLATHLEPLFDVPFAFFGHSFGSLIGFELARYLRRHNLPQPIHFFASAYPEPRIPSKSLDNLLMKLKQHDFNLFDLNQAGITQLSDEQLTTLSLLFKENGIADYGDERIDKNILNVLLPIFISDMNIVKQYHYYDEPSLELPITVFLGQQDTWVSPLDQMEWAFHSSKQCTFQEFDSGHLFIREKKVRLKVIQKVIEALRPYLEETHALN